MKKSRLLELAGIDNSLAVLEEGNKLDQRLLAASKKIFSYARSVLPKFKASGKLEEIYGVLAAEDDGDWEGISDDMMSGFENYAYDMDEDDREEIIQDLEGVVINVLDDLHGYKPQK